MTDSPKDSPSLDSKRQFRRRKILENAKSRMDKLKNVQRSKALSEQYSKDDNVNSHADPAMLDPDDSDPPDEVIPKFQVVSPPLSNSPNTQTQSSSRLANAVHTFSSKGLWRLRTFFTIVCATTVVALETTNGVVFSGAFLLFPLDCVLLMYAVFSPRPSVSNTGDRNPLGKLSLLKVPLMMLYPASAKLFDPVCFSIFLAGFLLCDVLFMLFCIILFKCALSYALSYQS